MSLSWTLDKQRVDRFEPEIKMLAGLHLVSTADPQVDRREATDLLVLTLQPFRVACRVRQHEYLARYGGEFTIRATRPSGVTSEMTKLVDGWCDYIFYGFANETDNRVAQWLIGDLNVFRAQLIRHPELTHRSLYANGDGSSEFYAFRVDEFPPEFVVASKQAA